MAYERQYTQGVGWENEPSINTPISAENLNQMDNAIQAVDLAVYNAIVELEAKGSQTFADYITSIGSNAPILNTVKNRWGYATFQEGEFLFLYCNIDAHYDSGWSGAWRISAGGVIDVGSIIDARSNNLDDNDFKEDIPAGSILVLAHYSTQYTAWGLYAIIPAASSGSAGTFYNTKISSASSGTMHSSLEVPSAFEDGDTILVQMNTSCTPSYLRLYFEYTVFDGSSYSTNVVTLYDATNGASGASYFAEDLKNGDILLLKQAGDKLTCAAYIPAAKTNFHNTKAEVASIGEISSGWTLSNYFESGDIIVVQMQTPGSPQGVTPMSEDKKWEFIYSVGASEITADVYDRTNEASGASYFDKELSKGDILLLEIVDNTRMDCIAYLPCSDVVVEHYNAIIDSVNNGEIISTLVLDKYLRYGDVIVVQMNDSGSPSGATPRWEFWYATDIDEYTSYCAYVYDKRNGANGTSYFAEDLSVGDILIFQVRTELKVDCVSYIPASGGGTTVVANPSGEATDNLEKIQIGSTIYDIPGTGGGGSGEGYEQELIYDIPTSSTGNITVSNFSNADSLTFVIGITVDSTDCQVFVQDVSMKEFLKGETIFLGGTLTESSGVTYSEYFGVKYINDTTINIRFKDGHAWAETGQLFRIYKNVHSSSLSVFSPEIYSEEEREVGVWTDGKPLYEITVSCGALPNNAEKDVSSGLTNEHVISIDGYSYSPTGGGTIKINHTAYPDSGMVMASYLHNTHKVHLYTASDRSAYTETYITLQYTKTTDTPGSAHWLPGGTIAVNYSTSEQIVGLYMGKTLYQKTIRFPKSDFTAGASNVLHNIANIDEAVSVFDIHIYRDSGASTFEYYQTNNWNLFVNDFSKTDIQVIIGADAYNRQDVVGVECTFRYTKTTDTPGTAGATILATQAELEAIADRITGTGRFVVSGEKATFIPIGS